MGNLIQLCLIPRCEYRSTPDSSSPVPKPQKRSRWSPGQLCLDLASCLDFPFSKFFLRHFKTGVTYLVRGIVGFDHPSSYGQQQVIVHAIDSAAQVPGPICEYRDYPPRWGSTFWLHPGCLQRDPDGRDFRLSTWE